MTFSGKHKVIAVVLIAISAIELAIAPIRFSSAYFGGGMLMTSGKRHERFMAYSKYWPIGTIFARKQCFATFSSSPTAYTMQYFTFNKNIWNGMNIESFRRKMPVPYASGSGHCSWRTVSGSGHASFLIVEHNEKNAISGIGIHGETPSDANPINVPYNLMGCYQFENEARQGDAP